MKELFKEYYTDEVIEKVLVRNSFVNLHGTIGIIAADGEPSSWIDNSSRVKMLIDEDNIKVVEVEEFSDVDETEFWEYTIEKQNTGKWLIVDIERRISYDYDAFGNILSETGIADNPIR